MDCGSDASWHYPWGLEMKPFKAVKAFVKTMSDTFGSTGRSQRRRFLACFLTRAVPRLSMLMRSYLDETVVCESEEAS